MALKDNRLRSDACGILKHFDKLPIEALSYLMDMLSEPRWKDAALQALSKIGPEAASNGIPALRREFWQSRQGNTRRLELAIAKLGRPMHPFIMEMIHSHEAILRRRAIGTVSWMGVAAEAFMPELEELFDDPDRDVRKGVLHAIIRLGAIAASITPALITCLKTEETCLHFEIIEALSRIGLAHESVVPTLIRILREGDLRDREYVLWGVAKHGPVTESIAEALIDELRSPECETSSSYRRAVVQSMIVMGPTVALAVEDIISLLNDESEYTRQDAREILVNVVRESDQGLHRLKRNENFRNWVVAQGKTLDEVVEELRNPVMWQMLHQSKSERPQFCEVCASLVHPTSHPLKYSRKGPVYACSFCGHTMN